MEKWSGESQVIREELNRLRRDVDRFFHASPTMLRPRLSHPWSKCRLLPLLNVRETADCFVVSTELPGMKTEDLNIRIEGDTLSIIGERRPEIVGAEVGYHRRERVIGTFHRSLKLPRKVDSDKVSATYKNGVLKVTLCKIDREPSRQTVKWID